MTVQEWLDSEDPANPGFRRSAQLSGEERRPLKPKLVQEWARLSQPQLESAWWAETWLGPAWVGVVEPRGGPMGLRGRMAFNTAMADCKWSESDGITR